MYLDCWVPAQFKASYEKYADSYCWIAGISYFNKIFYLSQFKLSFELVFDPLKNNYYH